MSIVTTWYLGIAELQVVGKAGEYCQVLKETDLESCPRVEYGAVWGQGEQ